MKRRDFVRTAAGTAAVTALAGCSTSTGTSDEAAADVPAPVPSEELLNEGGWSEVASTTERILDRDLLGGRVHVTADTHSKYYEDAALRSEMKEKTMGHFDAPLSAFSANRIALDPSPADLPFGMGVKEVLGKITEQVRTQFKSRLKDSNIENVRKTGEREISVATGGKATLTEFAAEYNYSKMEVPIPGRDGSQPLTIESGTLEINALLAVWRNDEYVMVAGGAHPAENFTETAKKDVTDAIQVTVDLDFGLEPKQYEAELLALIKSVE